jgi:isoleucyl-tRNA synthetase
LKNIDLHKPWIDNIKWECEKCGKEMKRVNEVIDCWYDSGSASFAQFHYPFENKEEFEKRFPYDFIAEAIDQTRGWFYTLHVLAAILFNNFAFKNVVCAGHIIDEKGEKMSKSKGNILSPDQVLNEVGVDAIRLQFCIFDIGDSKRFGINAVKKDVAPFLNILLNTFQFYKQIDNPESSKNRIEDKWIISRLNSVIKEATENLEKYYIERALKPIMSFVSEDFSRTYIKMIRDRDDKNVKIVMGEVLEKVCKLLSPYAPNISEFINKEFSKTSVHLAEWPKYEAGKIKPELEKEFEIAGKIIEAGLAARDKEGIGLRWPLGKAEIKSPALSNEIEEIILSQLNVKELEINKSEQIEVKLDLKMNSELEAEGYAREVARAVQASRKKFGLVKKDEINLAVSSEKKIIEMLKKNERFIKERTNARKMTITENIDDKSYKNKEEVNVRDKKIVILFSKI